MAREKTNDSLISAVKVGVGDELLDGCKGAEQGELDWATRSHRDATGEHGVPSRTCSGVSWSQLKLLCTVAEHREANAPS